MTFEDPPPLRRRRPDGTLYSRRQAIERCIVETRALPGEELIARARIRDPRHADFVPSEVLIHHLRATKGDNTPTRYEALLGIVRDRVERACPRANQRAGGRNIEVASFAELRDHIVERVLTLIFRDRDDYNDDLDYYEISFNHAVVQLKRTAFRGHYRRQEQSASLEEMLDTVERGNEGTEALSRLRTMLSQEADLAFRIDARRAIDALPDNQRRVIEMSLMGYKDQSDDPNEMTITKELGCTDKTVRNRRKAALEALRGRLRRGLTDAA